MEEEIMKKLNGKVVIITGGGQGIGFGIATAFAKEGADLVLTGRTESKLLKAKKSLEESYGIKVLPVVADGGNEEQVQNVIDKTIDVFGKIDTLINNAQASKSGVMLAWLYKRGFWSCYNVRSLCNIFLYESSISVFKRNERYLIINFASGAGLSGRVGQSSYAAAKEGIRGMSRVAAAEWAPYGININVICPLAMTEGLQAWKENYPELYAQTIKAVPMGRFADSETDIGRFCIFLSSEDAKYMTGETITLQGGSGLRP